MEIKRNPEIVWRIEVEEEDLLAQAREGKDISEEPMVTLVIADMVHQLNYMASKIWLLSDGSRREEDIVLEVLGNFEGSEETLKTDTKFFIDRLLKEGWLLYDKNQNP